MSVSSDLEVIKAIIDAFERSDWAEIDVRAGALRVHLSTQAQTQVSSARSTPAAARAESERGEDVVVAAPVPAAPAIAADIPVGAHVVVSPAPGIFWRSPSPGAPPFADVGNEVEAGATVCIVEVMKLMNHVVTEVAGIVVGVYVGNGTRVDLGDALFAVEPAQPS
jgi:acetyl-CoA carboxylase biotin carboxyl carrier protein